MRAALLLAALAVCLPAADLMESTAWVRGLDETTLRKLVPQQSGLCYVGCPNCNRGRQEHQLVWSPEHPDEIRCQFCGERYPSKRYPMRNEVTVRNPRGETQHYPYWEDSRGYRYFFAARRDDAVRQYLAEQTRDLARLYTATRDRAYARRAALLLDRFAQVFPGWCYHYDYPFQQKIIYDGNVPPARFRPGYRTARWTWWAYSDVPMMLVEAYDLIRDSGALDAAARRRIELDLFRNAARQVLANPEAFSNMSPGMWYSLITLGRVIGEPEYARECTRRLRAFLGTQFFYDGTWHEGAPSYHAQTLGGLQRVVRALGAADLEHMLAPAEASLAKMVLPDGRYVPVHDTWAHVVRQPPQVTRPYLLPALGHACMGGGTGAAQQQWHVAWSGGYGHQHADVLSLLLFAGGGEQLSDIGYTHTRYRAWTLATAAHNTVVIDGNNQAMRDNDGSLLRFEARDSMVQAVSVDGARAYPQAKVYRRTLLIIDAGESRRYAVDLFEVEGGTTHDYFLHGNADRHTEVHVKLPLQPFPGLLPAGWQPTANEGETRRIQQPGYAYGFLRKPRAATPTPGRPLAVDFEPGLRVTLIPEAGSLLVLGEDPAIRGANEDDGQLETVRRPFVMLRHGGGRSRFAAVMEPGKPFIESVEPLPVRGAALALKVRMGARTDRIVITPNGMSVTTPQGAWKSATHHRVPLEGVEPGALIAKASPAPGSIVRLLMADGWVYPYNVTAADGRRIQVAEGPGFEFDRAAQQVRFTSYPQRRHTGIPEVEW